MFDSYVLCAGSCQNRTGVNGNITGFEMKTLISYYRGIPLSMIHDIQVSVDGVAVAAENILFSPNGADYFSLKEMETVTSYKWEYGEKGTVFVLMDGGLSKGEHEVELTTIVRVSYVPVPFGGTRKEKVLIQ